MFTFKKNEKRTSLMYTNDYWLGSVESVGGGLFQVKSRDDAYTVVNSIEDGRQALLDWHSIGLAEKDVETIIE